MIKVTLHVGGLWSMKKGFAKNPTGQNLFLIILSTIITSTRPTITNSGQVSLIKYLIFASLSVLLPMPLTFLSLWMFFGTYQKL